MRVRQSTFLPILRAHCRAAALLLLIIPLSGCWSYSPARGPRADEPELLTRVDPAAWPPRDSAAVKPIFDATPNIIYQYALTDGADPAAVPENYKRVLGTPDYTVTYKGLVGLGLLRIYEPRPAVDKEAERWLSALDSFFTGFTPNAAFMTSTTIEDLNSARNSEARRLDRQKEDAELRLRAPMLRHTWVERDVSLTDGRGLRIPPERASSSAPYKGVLLHFQAIAGNPYEVKVLDEFRRRGWFIVDVDTFTSVRSPVQPNDLRTIEELEPRRDLAWKQLVGDDGARKWTVKDVRYKEWSELTTEISRLRAGSFQVCSDDDVPAAAKAIATAVDASLVSNAYAAEAVVEYLARERPDVPKHPFVVIGFSAGALAAPTSIARIRDHVDAAVLIGGGANLLNLAQTSTFTDAGLKVRCGKEKIPAARQRLLEKAYLEHSKLDPFHTAPTLRGMPILQVHGSWDTWVPAEGGDILYERLGRPDRLTIGGGHQMLFYFLPSQAKRIADWVDAALNPASP